MLAALARHGLTDLGEQSYLETLAQAQRSGDLKTCDTLDARQFLLAIKRLADSLSYGTDR